MWYQISLSFRSEKQTDFITFKFIFKRKAYFKFRSNSNIQMNKCRIFFQTET